MKQINDFEGSSKLKRLSATEPIKKARDKASKRGAIFEVVIHTPIPLTVGYQSIAGPQGEPRFPEQAHKSRNPHAAYYFIFAVVGPRKGYPREECQPFRFTVASYARARYRAAAKRVAGGEQSQLREGDVCLSRPTGTYDPVGKDQ